MSRVCIGVDGGGTTVRAVVVDEAGLELGRARGPGAVLLQSDPEGAIEATASVVRDALRAAGISGPADVLWAGLAGAGRAAGRDTARLELRRKGLANRVVVGTDVEAAFADAFRGGPGILTIAGTGSIVRGRDADGEMHRVGGWGATLGDEGGGYWVGIQALRLLLRMHDGRATTSQPLVDALCDALSLETPDAAISWIETADKAAVAALVPVVRRTAEAGDGAAGALLDAAATVLVEQIAAILRCSDAWPSPTPLALWGGLVAETDGALHPRLVARLPEGLELTTRPIDPPMGAARRALSLEDASDRSVR